ncbi:MAG: OstA-like protein [Saprospiraceae bacterium]
MFFSKKNFRAALWALLCLPTLLVAQQIDPADKRLRIEDAALIETYQSGNKIRQKLSGNVRMRQEKIQIFCDEAIKDGDDAVLRGNVVIIQQDTIRIFADSALYFGETRYSDLFGNVALENGARRLFTQRLDYDMANKIAIYRSGALLTDGQTQLSSRYGYYYVNDKEIFFKNEVLIVDPEFTLRTDTLAYQTETGIARFLAPTLISLPDARIYTEAGYYDTENQFAEFDKNPQYERGEQKGRAKIIRYNGITKTFSLTGEAEIRERDQLMTGDEVRYYANTKDAEMIGNGYYRDSVQEVRSERIVYNEASKRYRLSGRSIVSNPPNIIVADSLDFNDLLGAGLAIGDVVWRDTAADFSILAARMDYNKQNEYLHATGGFGARTGRPLLKSLLEGDTLYMSADTLLAFKPDSASEAKTLLAYRDARIFKSNLQGVADSISFNSADSIFRFYPIRSKPLLWADTSQFAGDTILMRLKDKRLDRIWMRQNAFLINSEDEVMFNQIKGRNCTAYFDENQLKEMWVEGNAQAYYYALDERKAYVGLNETECAEMRLYFQNNQVEGIRFYDEPKGKFSPMKDAGASETRKLEGFNWFEAQKRRPRSIQDILRQYDD